MNYRDNLVSERLQWCGSCEGIVVQLSDVLLVDNLNPGNVYSYDPDTKTSILLPVPSIPSFCVDISHTINKLWIPVFNGVASVFREWDITLNPFTAIFNRDLTNIHFSEGLHAVNDNLLITHELYVVPAEAIYYETDITSNPVSNLQKFIGEYRFIVGDYILTTTGKIIAIEGIPNTGEQVIAQYDYATGVLELNIDITLVFVYGTSYATGLFEYDSEIYIAGLNATNGIIYKIDKLYPYTLTLFDTTTYRINGASQVQSQLTEHFVVID